MSGCGGSGRGLRPLPKQDQPQSAAPVYWGLVPFSKDRDAMWLKNPAFRRGSVVRCSLSPRRHLVAIVVSNSPTITRYGSGPAVCPTDSMHSSNLLYTLSHGIGRVACYANLFVHVPLLDLYRHVWLPRCALRSRSHLLLGDRSHLKFFAAHPH
jgi:hypothetical protein